jgi:hypothetical protein
MLMMSAAFGKVYLPQYDNMEFAKAIQIIRTRNLFRDKLNVIVPAEILRTLDVVTPGDIVHRIAGRGLIAEAIEYADQLGCDKVPIVTDWCTQVISKVKDDQIAFRLISQKMTAAFDPTAVASVANSMGRTDLALQIAAAEKNRSRVVPFYMKLKRSEEALRATADSGDSTLFLSVLRELVEQAEGEEELASLSRTVARDFFSFSSLAKYVQSGAIGPKYSSVLRIAPPIPQTLDIVFKVRLEGLRKDPSEAKIAELLKFLKNKRKEFSKAVPWLRDVCDLLKSQVKLIQQQAKFLEERSTSAFPPGMSANDVIRRILRTPAGLELALGFGEKLKPAINRSRIVAIASAFYASEQRWELFKNLCDPSSGTIGPI